MSCKERSGGGKQDRIKRYVESILDVYDLTLEERARCMEQAEELIAGLSVQMGEEKFTAEEILRHEEEGNQEAEGKDQGAGAGGDGAGMEAH